MFGLKMVGNMIRETIQGMDRSRMGAEIDGAGDTFRLRIHSNVDDRVSQDLKRAAGRQFLEVQARIRQRLLNAKDEKWRPVADLIPQKQDEVTGPIKYTEEQIEGLQRRIEEQIEAVGEDIEPRKKDEAESLKNKADDVLKGLLEKKKE